MSTEASKVEPEDPRDADPTTSGAPTLDQARSAVFGIKAKLFLAITTLAALTAASAVVAWTVFGNIERTVLRVTEKSLPNIVTSQKLAEVSAEIASTAPAVMASNTQEARVREQVRLSTRVQVLKAQIGNLKESGADPNVVSSLLVLADDIAAQLQLLDLSVGRQLKLAQQIQAELNRLSKTSEKFLEVLEPLIDDSVFDLVIDSERVTEDGTRKINELVEGGVRTLDRLLTVNAEGNLAAGLLAEALNVNTANLLQPIRERYIAAADQIGRNLQQLPEGNGKEALVNATTEILNLGSSSDNIFTSRDHILQTLAIDPQAKKMRSVRLEDALKTAHEQFLLTVTPMIDDAVFELVLSTEGLTKGSTSAIRELVDVGANSLHVLLSVRAEGNLATSLLSEAASTNNVNLLQPLHERFVAAEGQIRRQFQQLPAAIHGQEIQELITVLFELGKGGDGVFALRRSELLQKAKSQSALEESRKLAISLGDEVATLVGTASANSKAAAARSSEAIETGKLFVLILTAASLLGAGVVAFAYVGPRIVRPLHKITKAMSDLAAGDTSVDIPGRERTDELGRMAQALGTFRDTAIEAQKSNLKEIRETRRRLADAIESISEAFSLYDSDDRLVICNNMYRTLLYPDIAEEIVPGMSFEAIVRRAAERGYIKDASGRLEEWLRDRLTRHRDPDGPHLQQRADGRWIMVSERKTEEGGIVAVYSDITELKQREAELAEKSKAMERLSGQLAKYLSPQVYESIFTGKQEVKLHSRRKKLTVFFSDIAGFTETADRLESEELTELLNHYLSEMSQIALQHGATIDKYVGDAIVIFFGDPESRGIKQDALACVKMAIAMRKRMVELQSVWREAGTEQPLQCRMGINTGFCTVGNFGSADRMDYTIIGGGVNLASRLESSAVPGQILLSYETFAQVKDEIMCEEKETIRVKGIAYPVVTYQVVDSYENLESSRQVVREERPNLKLDIDIDAMSDDDRKRATTLLKQVIERLHFSSNS